MSYQQQQDFGGPQGGPPRAQYGQQPSRGIGGINQQKIENFLSSAEVHLTRMFIAGCIFGALACFGRADYNLPLFAFLVVMFEKDDVSTLLSSLKSNSGYRLTS